jgi:FKBP-type peptidyl-prolyl cis-trans isomerase SlyD
MSVSEVIRDNKVVDLAFTLKGDDGKILDQAEKDDPFTYLHGAEQVVPGLEVGLEGLKIGDKKKVVVSAAEGYGEMDSRLKVTASRSQFPKDVEIEVGLQFETETPDGEEIVFTVCAIEGDQVTVDGNHPLAGQTLHFEVEVLKIRDATADELEHGHAHGPEGHEHLH